MATTDDRVSKDVQRTMDRMVDGYDKKDVELILGCYEAEASYATAVGHAVTGAPDLRNLFDQILSMDPDFSFRGHEVVLADDLALHISAYDSRRADGSVHRGLSVAVLRRQADDRWLMVLDHPSGDRLLAP